jgi:hypothetical protein
MVKMNLLGLALLPAEVAARAVALDDVRAFDLAPAAGA